MQRDGRYALHCAVEDPGGGGGEFYVRGQGRLLEDRASREVATSHARYVPADRYILFELDVDFAFSNVYEEGGSVQCRWRRASE
ncbi:MAG: hypothetical protein M3220_18490 [Chloroflexota bacterium]|nr:hypothetical protein [Chloroflexota bacterium]